jgi:Icc-related predicted phosphoesterase
MKNQITLIGDVHGKYKRYHEIIREKDRHEYTIQIGDFGLSNYDTLDNVDYNKHRIILGNHDNPDLAKQYPHFNGDYGYAVNFNGLDYFWYRGAYSIDKEWRTAGYNWFFNEEVNIETFMKARELYREIKPDIVLTHDCPENVLEHILPSGSRIFQNTTSWALQELFNIHQPKIWRFGHHHKSWRMTINNTDFRCLNELETEVLTV